VQNKKVLIKEITAWQSDYCLTAVRFTFQNEDNIHITDIFGTTTDKSGNKLTSVNVAIGKPVMSMQTLFVNT